MGMIYATNESDDNMTELTDEYSGDEPANPISDINRPNETDYVALLEMMDDFFSKYPSLPEILLRFKKKVQSSDDYFKAEKVLVRSGTGIKTVCTASLVENFEGTVTIRTVIWARQQFPDYRRGTYEGRATLLLDYDRVQIYMPKIFGAIAALKDPQVTPVFLYKPHHQHLEIKCNPEFDLEFVFY